MHESRRNQLVSTAVLLMIFLLAMLIATNLNHFALPLSPNNFVPPSNKGSSSNAEGLLHITTESNLTVFPNFQPSSSVVQSARSNTLGDPGFLNHPVQEVAVSITNVQTNSHTSGTTDSYGQLELYLPAAEYSVEFLDWRFNYSSLTVEIHSGQMTDLRAYINANAYHAQWFNIIDADSSGWVTGWQHLYMLVQSTNTVSGSGTSTFIETGTVSPSATLSSQNTSRLTEVSVITRFEEQNSEWLGVQVRSPVSIQSIQGLQLISINDTYEVSSAYLAN